MPAKRSVTPAAVSADVNANSIKPSTAAASKPPPSSSGSTASTNPQSAQQILESIWSRYMRETPTRTKLIDIFMGFLMIVGGLQFVYCCLVGTFPFNAFLSGFSACVGQFVLAASLRMQTNPENKKNFSSRSDERAFAEFVFGSLILHFFCVNFIN